MKATYDKEADAMYLFLRKGKVKKTVCVNPRVLLDVGEKGEALGIEFLFVFQAMSKLRPFAPSLS